MRTTAASAYTKTKHMIGGNILHVCPEGKLSQCSTLNEEMSIQHGKKHQWTKSSEYKLDGVGTVDNRPSTD